MELDEADSFPFHAGDPTLVLDQVEQFLTGMRASPALDRTLATVLMTDIVDSTGCAARLGDHRWLELRAAHDRLAREPIARYRGREVDATGDSSWSSSTARRVRSPVRPKRRNGSAR